MAAGPPWAWVLAVGITSRLMIDIPRPQFLLFWHCRGAGTPSSLLVTLVGATPSPPLCSEGAEVEPPPQPAPRVMRPALRDHVKASGGKGGAFHLNKRWFMGSCGPDCNGEKGAWSTAYTGVLVPVQRLRLYRQCLHIATWSIGQSPAVLPSNAVRQTASSALILLPHTPSVRITDPDPSTAGDRTSGPLIAAISSDEA